MEMKKRESRVKRKEDKEGMNEEVEKEKVKMRKRIGVRGKRET